MEVQYIINSAEKQNVERKVIAKEGEITMRKRILILFLLTALLMNSVKIVNPVHAENTKNSQETFGMQNRSTEKIVYLEDGEGTEGEGKGTKDSPFQNIRTALKHIQDGEILKLVGLVKYTNYEKHTDGSAKPLFFNKAITVEGDDEFSGLMLRSTIQLGADVEFRNMNLQMIPEVLLGRMLGQQVERSTTIFAAGHTLVLNNVNTKLSSSVQSSVRPYISGGAYKGLGTLGEKAVIRITNPSSETKLAGIYAGDYWNDRKMDVEIHLNARLLDQVLYTGGVNGILDGNVEVILYGESNLAGFDRSNHNGNVNVRVAESAFIDSASLINVNEVVLENKARITLPASGGFDVEKVILKNESILDFRAMKNSPSIAGDFIGSSNLETLQKAGAVLLNNEQTLQVGGSVRGFTRLNSNGLENIARFLDGHIYISADKASDGDFSIEGTAHTEFEIHKNTEQGKDVWKVCKKKIDDLDKFNHFAWQGGKDEIVNPQFGDEFVYPILFYNNNDTEYKPGMFELLEDFEFNLVRKDGEELDLEWDIFTDWDYEQMEEDAPVQLKLTVYNPEKAYGELMLTVTHLESGEKIERIISVLQASEAPSMEPSEAPSVEPSEVPSVEPSEVPSVKPSEAPSVEPSEAPSMKPSEAPGLKPASIKLNTTKATLYTTGSTALQLKPTIVGISNLVKYTSSNSQIAKVDKYGKVTAVAAGEVKITAEANSVKAYCTVTVKRTSLKLNVNKATIYTAGKTIMRIKPTTVGISQKVRYYSNNQKIAKVDKYGKVTAVKAGTAVITVEANGLSQMCTITVKKPEVKISKTHLIVSRGRKVTISAKAIPKGTITFVSSNKKVAAVNKQGVVTGLKVGNAIITVKCNGVTKKVTVNVKK